MAKSSTSFGEGTSGNPGGRKAPSKEVRELAGKYTAESIERLVEWMRSENPTASVAACIALLDRAHGKPLQTMEHGGLDGEPMSIVINFSKGTKQ